MAQSSTQVGLRYVQITGILKCKEGTRIGGSKDELEIGGLDNPIIRDPVDKFPYIPGSSLKGKLRSLLEYKYKLVQDGNPCGCKRPLGNPPDGCPVCTLFGPHRAKSHNLKPSRLIFRDALMTEQSKEGLAKLVDEGLMYAEIKTENSINRQTGTARDPRPMERVPKDTRFHLNISLRVFEGDKEEVMIRYLKEALEMLQQDYLGGSGTRGYGWVEIEDLKIDGELA